MSTAEMRAVLTESSGELPFDPPYMTASTGAWSLVEPQLTIDFPTGQVVFNRE